MGSVSAAAPKMDTGTEEKPRIISLNYPLQPEQGYEGKVTIQDNNNILKFEKNEWVIFCSTDNRPLQILLSPPEAYSTPVFRSGDAPLQITKEPENGAEIMCALLLTDAQGRTKPGLPDEYAKAHAIRPEALQQIGHGVFPTPP